MKDRVGTSWVDTSKIAELESALRERYADLDIAVAGEAAAQRAHVLASASADPTHERQALDELIAARRGAAQAWRAVEDALAAKRRNSRRANAPRRCNPRCANPEHGHKKVWSFDFESPFKKPGHRDDFVAGYSAGSSALARDPWIDQGHARRAYRKVSMRHGTWWIDGYGAAIDISRGAVNTGPAQIARWLELAPAPMRNPRPRSFRTKTLSAKKGVKGVVGCPRGEWDARAQRCRVGTRMQAMLRPKTRSEVARARGSGAPMLAAVGNPPMAWKESISPRMGSTRGARHYSAHVGPIGFYIGKRGGEGAWTLTTDDGRRSFSESHRVLGKFASVAEAKVAAEQHAQGTGPMANPLLAIVGNPAILDGRRLTPGQCRALVHCGVLPNGARTNADAGNPQLRWMSVRMSDVVRAIDRARKAFPNDWQAEVIEVLLLPSVYKRWQALNSRVGKPIIRRVRNEKFGSGYVLEWEFKGQVVSRWNAVRDDYYSHSPSTTYNGIGRETVFQFAEALRSIARSPDAGSALDAYRDALNDKRVRLVLDSPGAPWAWTQTTHGVAGEYGAQPYLGARANPLTRSEAGWGLETTSDLLKFAAGPWGYGRAAGYGMAVEDFSELGTAERDMAIELRRRAERAAPRANPPEKTPTAYEHLQGDWDRRPRQIAEHLRADHGIEPKVARKGYEREVWHSQHESLHYGGISGSQHALPSSHTRVNPGTSLARIESAPGFAAAAAKVQEFHGAPATRVKVVRVPDGKKGVTRKAVAWLGVAPVTEYEVPAKSSNKHGYRWEHKNGERGGKPPELVYDPETKIVSLLGGTLKVKGWLEH